MQYLHDMRKADQVANTSIHSLQNCATVAEVLLTELSPLGIIEQDKSPIDLCSHEISNQA